MESIESIARWHRETFPDATVLSQQKKFQEELKEWHESQHITDQGLILGDITELADMFIVACGLARFNNADALFAFRTVSEELSHSMYPTIDLEMAIMKKMKINRARKWENNDGLYRHKED